MRLSLTEASYTLRGCILASGTFDLLHIGHVRYLQTAKKMADLPLVVAITSGEYINRPGRPVFTNDERAEMLEALSCVDAVVIIHERTMMTAIEALKPALYVKGQETRRDGNADLALEMAAVKRNGGETRFIGITCRYSSGALLRGDYLSKHITAKPIE